MASHRNHRKAERRILDIPKIGMVSVESDGVKSSFFVTVVNLSVQGALIESEKKLETDVEVHFSIYNDAINQWDTFFSRVVWNQTGDTDLSIHLGLEYLFPVENLDAVIDESSTQIPLKDVTFLLNSIILNPIQELGLAPLLNVIKKRIIEKDTLLYDLIPQRDCLFLIQKGFCSVTTSTKSISPVAFRSEGEIVGDIPFFENGQNHTLRITAESKMIVWVLNRKDFNTVIRNHPDLSRFLTVLFLRQLDNPDSKGLRQVDPFRLQYHIGADAFFLKFKASHHTLDIPVRLNMLKYEHAAKKNLLNEIIRRSKIVRKLNHPNFFQLLDIKNHSGTVFICFADMDGETLDIRMKRSGRISFFNAVKIVHQLASALVQAHRHKLYFYLILPENIVISSDRQLKLLNMEIPYMDISSRHYPAHYKDYLPPEAFKSKKLADFDIFGFGRIAFEIMTGKHFDPMLQPGRQIEATFNRAFDPNNLPFPNLINGLKSIISKACSHSNNRYKSMQELFDDLSRLLSAELADLELDSVEKKHTTVLLVHHHDFQTGALYEMLDQFESLAQSHGLQLSYAKTDPFHAGE